MAVDSVVTSPATNGRPARRAGGSTLADQYTVTLRVNDDKGESFEIESSLDESFSLSLGSQWNAPFENVLKEAMNAAGVGGAGDAVSAVTGMQGRSKLQSAQVWQSSDPMHMTIPFTLIARSNPATEIKDKVRKMLKLVAPSEWKGLLKAPGPTLLDKVRGGRNISVQIGSFLILKDVVVTRVDVQFDSIIGQSGIPHKAKVNVDIASFYTCFTTQDIDGMFLGS